jgi:hypothetical protein
MNQKRMGEFKWPDCGELTRHIADSGEHLQSTNSKKQKLSISLDLGDSEAQVVV